MAFHFHFHFHFTYKLIFTGIGLSCGQNALQIAYISLECGFALTPARNSEVYIIH